MSARAGLLLAAALACAGAARAAAAPALTLTASATNLVVTESTVVRLDLVLAPLEKSNADHPPFLNNPAPHLTAAFLEPDWKVGAFEPADPKMPLDLPQARGRNLPSFSLNKYMTDGLFSGMSDPFSLLDDDDFFGRVGPRKQLFPFATARDEDGTWRFSVVLTPWRAAAAGTVTLPEVRMDVPVITGVRSRRDRFGRTRNEAVVSNIVLRAGPLELRVSEPPAQGRPAGWCGAVASNLTVTAKLDTNVCTAGDPLTLTVDVLGAANPAAVHPPDFARQLADGAFRLDAASAKTETLTDGRRFTWRVRPVKTGTIEFPALAVAFYNLGARAYETRRTETIPLQVKAGAQAALGALEDDAEGEAEFPNPDGLDFDPRGARAEPLLPHLTLALLLFAVPPVVFLIVSRLPGVRRRVAARRAAARKARAFKRCRRALRARDPAKRAAAIRAFFRDRYDVNGAAVTAADAARLMAADYAEEEVALVTRALEELAARTYSAGRAAVTLLVLCAALWTCGAARAAEPRLEFSWKRANAAAARAADADGFARAADAYQACVEAGAANPVVFANLGACRVMAGDGARAAAAFAAAERRGGETPSTARGVRAAWARVKADPRAEPPLARVFFRPHYLWTLDTRLLVCAGAWALLWLALLLPPGFLRRFFVSLSSVVFVAFALSVVISLAGEYVSAL